MRTSCFKMVQIAAGVGLAFSLIACDNVRFGSQGSSAKVTGGANDAQSLEDLVFLQDSFERDDIFSDLANNIIYGWRGFVLDGANPVLGFQSNGAGSSIPALGQLGPAQDGQRFLLMNGRDNGTNVETVELVTPSYDLSQYNTAIITFRYLTFGLNDADDTVAETLQLQVCRGTLNECGANDDALDASGLQGDRWVTVFTNDPNVNDDALNGKNHVASDWQPGIAVIDLNNPAFVGNSSTFVIRFVGVVRDGFTPGTVVPGSDSDSDKNCKCHDDDDDKDHDDDDDKDDDRHVATLSKFTSSDDKDNDDDKDHSDQGKKRDCKNKKHKHEKHNKHCKHKKHKCCKCHNGGDTTTTPGDGTLKDGIAIDNVKGVATQLTIDEIF